MIHSTAVIHPGAQLGNRIQIGPGAVIDGEVSLGDDCVVGPHAYLTGLLQAGARNRFHAGCVIGDAPQDLKYKGEATGLRIGDDNVFREHVTVHRSAKVEEDTVIGSGNFLMAGSHVAHNCAVGNHVIIANGALLGGHVIVQDRAFISGNCLVHQFARVGRLALMQGSSAISRDLPPFTIARGPNGICGLNIIGLRRAGFDAATRLELKRLYHFLFRSGRNLTSILDSAADEFKSGASREMIEFVRSAKRGVCFDTSTGAEDAAEED